MQPDKFSLTVLSEDATEIVAMEIELFICEPRWLLREDAASWEFLYNLLTGR